MADLGGFEWYDYLIFAVMLTLSLSTGIYQAFTGGKQRTTSEYLMGDRKLLMIPVAVSMFMTRVSAIMILGNTAEVYNYGVTAWTSCIGTILSLIYSIPLFVPTFYKLRLTSINEYLQNRYDSRAVKLTAMTLSLIHSLFYCGLAMYSPATALAAVTPIETWISITVTGVVVTLYTMIGGMKAVVWTDVIQGLIMGLGIILILAFGSSRTNGFENAWNIAQQQGRLDVIFSTNPYVRVSFWAVSVSNFFQGLFLVSQQSMAQRYAAVTSVKRAMWTASINSLFFVLAYSLTCLVGIVVFAYYHIEGCDPIRDGRLSSSNQILPYFVVTALDVPALPGLFVAVLFAGALSSVSSHLTSMVANLWKDVIEPFTPKDMSEYKRALINKCLVLILGIIAIFVSFLNSLLPGHVMQIASSVLGALGGPTAGIFLLSLFFPWANWIGALVGMLVGFGFGLTLSIGNNEVNPYRMHLNTSVTECVGNVTAISEDLDDVMGLWRISFHYFSVLGTLATAITGAIVSLITGPRKAATVSPKMIAPVAEKLCWYLPETIRKIFWCGVRFDHLEDEYLADMPRSNSMVLEKMPNNIRPLSFKSSESNLNGSTTAGKTNDAYLFGDENAKTNEKF